MLDEEHKGRGFDKFIIAPGDKKERENFLEVYEKSIGQIQNYKTDNLNEEVYVYSVTSNQFNALLGQGLTGKLEKIIYEFGDIFDSTYIQKLGKHIQFDSTDIIKMIKVYLKRGHLNAIEEQIENYVTGKNIIKFDITDNIPDSNFDYPPYFLVESKEQAEEIYKEFINVGDFNVYTDSISKFDFFKGVFISINY